MPRISMEAHSPKGISGVDFLNSERAAKKIRMEFERLAKVAKAEFEKSTETWTNKPQFQIRGSWKEANVYTDDTVYKYLNDGTDSHFVTTPYVAVGGAMQFKTGYTSKTKVGSLNASGGGAEGAQVYSKGHYVKGIQPRHFDELVYKAVQEEIEKSSPEWFKDMF